MTPFQSHASEGLPCTHGFLQVSIVAEQLLRLLHACGMPATDVDLLLGPGDTMGEAIRRAEPRSTLFTGSQRVAERLAVQTHGKVRGVWGGVCANSSTTGTELRCGEGKELHMDRQCCGRGTGGADARKVRRCVPVSYLH